MIHLAAASRRTGFEEEDENDWCGHEPPQTHIEIGPDKAFSAQSSKHHSKSYHPRPLFWPTKTGESWI